MHCPGVTTNNYGFAPTAIMGPERFQKQMYQELYDMLAKAQAITPGMNILEVSCGRGGGLRHLVGQWPVAVSAIGMDRAGNAVAACQKLHAGVAGLRFQEGDALHLPFADHSFDALFNVEASNDYGNYAQFYKEVARVLKPGGYFLYADTRRAKIIEATMSQLRKTGFVFDVRDITSHVLAACDGDQERRRGLIARAPLLIRLLFPKELKSYAALPGSKQYEAFRTRFRHYLMVCAKKS
jgi:ubiquinone/menaquinone biosynthesis C-methylase UbiE